MAISITRQEKENNQSVIRRFTKRMRESGILKAAKGRVFYMKPKTGEALKKAALRRIEKKKIYEYDKKMGKI